MFGFREDVNIADYTRDQRFGFHNNFLFCCAGPGKFYYFTEHHWSREYV